MRSVFVKSLYDQRRAVLGFGLGTALLVLLECAMWPSIRSMPALDEFLANYPEAMRRLFNLQDLGTGTGFVNAELFSLLLPILFLAFAIARGARAVAGEEEAGTLDILLVTPVTTASLVLQQAAALLVSVLVLGGVLYAAVMIGSVVFGLGVGASGLLAAVLATVALAVEFGWIALAVGAARGRRAVAIGAATVLAVGSYVLYVAGELTDAVRPWQSLSPFHQAVSGGPLGAGFQAAVLILPLTGAALIAAALPMFARRDIAVAH